MQEWKTMLEVAKELGITKSLVKYHRQKLQSGEVKVENGLTFISPQGVSKIKSFLRSVDYSEEFETVIQNQLNVIQELLINLQTSPRSEKKTTKEKIENFTKFLIENSDTKEVLEILQKQSVGTFESELYFLLLDYVERKQNYIAAFSDMGEN